MNTEGFACPNPQCAYFGITDGQIHALVGDGKHGHAEQIQTFRGPACRTTFSARRHTPLYRLKTPAHQIAMVLSALAEGLDSSAAERVFGFRQATITSHKDSSGASARPPHAAHGTPGHPLLAKKCYRRRKLMRVMHVMRLGTEGALKAARPRIGPLWEAEHRFY